MFANPVVEIFHIQLCTRKLAMLVFFYYLFYPLIALTLLFHNTIIPYFTILYYTFQPCPKSITTNQLSTTIKTITITITIIFQTLTDYSILLFLYSYRYQGTKSHPATPMGVGVKPVADPVDMSKWTKGIESLALQKKFQVCGQMWVGGCVLCLDYRAQSWT